MEHKLGQYSRTAVGQATVPEHKLAELTELFKGKVTCEGSLKAFFTLNADAHIRLHDHTDIISTVTDTSDALASCVLF